MGEASGAFWPQIAISAYIGFCIYLTAVAVLVLVRPVIGHFRGWLRRLTIAGSFFVAGVFGWTVAFGSLPVVTGGRWTIAPVSLLVAFSFTGGLGVVVGLLAYSYELLRLRLKRSTERLKEQEFAERELSMARDIQRRLLPPEEVAGDGYFLAARNLPATIIAGDFYDIVRRRDGTLGIAVGDVAGKGMGASLIMALIKGMLPLIAAELPAAETMRALNNRLAGELGRREFVALCYLEFDPLTGRFTIANAGLPDPYLLRAGDGGRPLTVNGERIPLGIRPEVRYEEVSGSLACGERMFIATDGLYEAVAPDGQPVGYEHLESLLQFHHDDPSQWLDQLLRRVDAASRREDDVTTLLLERRENARHG